MRHWIHIIPSKFTTATFRPMSSLGIVFLGLTVSIKSHCTYVRRSRSTLWFFFTKPQLNTYTMVTTVEPVLFPFKCLHSLIVQPGISYFVLASAWNAINLNRAPALVLQTALFWCYFGVHINLSNGLSCKSYTVSRFTAIIFYWTSLYEYPRRSI